MTNPIALENSLFPISQAEAAAVERMLDRNQWHDPSWMIDRRAPARLRRPLRLVYGPGGPSLQVRNHYGFVHLLGRTINIRPKVDAYEPGGHFDRWIAISSQPGPPAIGDRIRPIALPDRLGTHLLALYESFVLATEQASAHGQHRDYQETDELVPFPVGRLHPLPTTLNLLQGRIRFDCTVDRLCEDHALNRVIRAALESVELGLNRTGYGGSLLLSRTRLLMREFSGAGPVRPSDTHTAATDRLSHRYSASLTLAVEILSAMSLSLGAGDRDVVSMLFSTWRVFEHAVTHVIAEQSAALGLNCRSKTINSRSGAEQYHADVVVSDETRNLAVAEVKYKFIEGAHRSYESTRGWPARHWSDPLRKELYEACTFGAAAGTRKIALILIGATRDGLLACGLSTPATPGRLTVTPLIWDVSLEVAAAETRFRDAVTDWLGL